MKKNVKSLRACLGSVLVVVLAIGLYMDVYASQSGLVPVNTNPEDIISVELPTTSKSDGSLFDFILDPQGLINATNAIRYGGRTFEEGSTLYFENSDGAYNFSKNSDRLTITNQSTVPVKVTIHARIENLDNIVITQDNSFVGDKNSSIYMALIDKEGTVVPFDANGEAVMIQEIDAAPENAYVYCYDEVTQTYQYEMMADSEAFLFDTYEFGLTGACNTNGNWAKVTDKPQLTVMWMVEPVTTESRNNQTVDIEENTITNEGDVQSQVSGGDGVSDNDWVPESGNMQENVGVSSGDL